MRKGHEYECFLHGADEVEDYIVENYPRERGIKTHFITGNHDLSMVKCAGVDIGKRVTQRRSDMIYLGQLNARVWLTPNCDLELNHPLDGSSYAYSYATQKYCDAMQGGSKPKILASGHHHKFFYMVYRNIHVLEVPAFQAQTSWMRGKRLVADVGYLVVTINVDKEGTILRFTPEYVPIYKMIEKV